MIKMIWKTLAVDKMDIEKTADLKCISRLLVEKWHVDQIKMKITVSPKPGKKNRRPGFWWGTAPEMIFFVVLTKLFYVGSCGFRSVSLM